MSVVIRGKRQNVINFGLIGFSLCLFIFLTIDIAVTDASQFQSVEVLLFSVIALEVLAFLRALQSSLVEIVDDVFVYKTLVRTRKFHRRDVTECGVATKYRGVVKLWQPYLILSNGKKIWLADMSYGIRSGIGEKDGVPNKRIDELLAAVEGWLGVKEDAGA